MSPVPSHPVVDLEEWFGLDDPLKEPKSNQRIKAGVWILQAPILPSLEIMLAPSSYIRNLKPLRASFGVNSTSVGGLALQNRRRRITATGG